MLVVTDFLYQALNHFEWELKMYIKAGMLWGRLCVGCTVEFTWRHTTAPLNIYMREKKKGKWFLSSFFHLSHALVHVLYIMYEINLMRLEQHFLIFHCLMGKRFRYAVHNGNCYRINFSFSRGWQMVCKRTVKFMLWFFSFHFSFTFLFMLLTCLRKLLIESIQEIENKWICSEHKKVSMR